MEKQQYSRYFICDQRIDGVNFMKLTNEAPEELRKLIYDIHQEFDRCMPDDWIYDVIHDAFCQHDDGETLDNINLEPDPYHSNLYKWLGEAFADEFINHAMKEFGEFKDIYHLIGMAQVMAKENIYSRVFSFFDEE